MYEAYMAEMLSRSESDQIDRLVERRRIAAERSATAPAPFEVRTRRPGFAPQPAPCLGCPA